MGIRGCCLTDVNEGWNEGWPELWDVEPRHPGNGDGNLLRDAGRGLLDCCHNLCPNGGLFIL
jgi:hypothetical protein